MPAAKKTRKVKDKWREKRWVVVEAPRSFGSTPIAYIPITDPQKAVGRVVETTLYDLVKQDPQQYSIKLFFQLVKVEDERGIAVFKGHEYAREYLRSLIRRGSSMVVAIDDYTTKDGVAVRAQTVLFAQGRINSARKHALREIAHRVVMQKAAALTYDQFAQEAVLGKIASDVYNEAKRIIQLRHVGVRKTKLLSPPERALSSEPAPVVQEAVAARPAS